MSQEGQKENLTIKEIPGEMFQEIQDLREEARSLNEGMEVERTKYRNFLVRLEAFNLKVEGLLKNLIQ